MPCFYRHMRARARLVGRVAHKHAFIAGHETGNDKDMLKVWAFWKRGAQWIKTSWDFHGVALALHPIIMMMTRTLMHTKCNGGGSWYFKMSLLGGMVVRWRWCEAKRYSCILLVCGDDDDDDGEMESEILELLFAQDRIHSIAGREYACTSIIYFYLYQFPFPSSLCSFRLLCYRSRSTNESYSSLARNNVTVITGWRISGRGWNWVEDMDVEQCIGNMGMKLMEGKWVK